MTPLAEAAAFLALPRSRGEARTQNAKHYFTGLSCERGHVTARLTSHGRCVECGKEDDRRRYAKKRDAILAYRAELYLRQAEEMRQRTRDWRKNNPDKAREQWRNRKAAKRHAEGKHSADDVKMLATWQRHKCAWCAARIKSGFHVDHIVPISKGGTNWPRNLQLLCAPCNQRKHARDPIVFARVEGRLL